MSLKLEKPAECSQAQRNRRRKAPGHVPRDTIGSSLYAEAVELSKYHKIFLASPDSITITTFPEGRFVEVNPAFERLTSYRSYEVIGRTAIELNIWADPAERTRMISSLREQGRVQDFKMNFRTKSGQVHVASLSAELIGLREVQYVLAVVRDITESKLAQKGLEEQTAHLTALIENNPLAIVVLDSAQQVQMCNPAFERLFLYRADEAKGKALDELITTPEMLSEAADLTRRAFVGETFHGTARRRRKDGTLVDVEFHGVPLRVHGKLVGTYALYQDVTEQKRAEKALQESEKRFRLLLETIPHGIEAINGSGIILYANSAHHKQYEYDQGELIGKSILDLVATNSERETLRNYLAYLIQEQPPPVPYFGRKRTKTGRVIDVQVNWDYRRDEQERVTGFTSVITDISERKRADDALRTSEANLARAQRIAHLGSWEWNIANNALLWSDETYRLFGLIPQAFGMTYEGFLNCVQPDDRELVKTAMKEALSRRKPCNIDYRFIRPDGTERFVHCQGQVTFDDSGRAIRMIGTVQDITKRKQAEATLRERDQHLQTLVSMAPTAIISLDNHGTVLSWNREASRLFGWSARETIGRLLLIVPPDKKEEYEWIQQKCLMGKTVSLDTTRQQEDGRLVNVHLSVAPLRDARGNICGSMVVAKDISERKRMELALRESEREHRALFENANDPIVIFDPEDEIVLEVNQKACKTYGFSREELVGMNVKKLAKEGSSPSSLRFCPTPDSCRSTETIHFDKEGKAINVLVSCSAVEYRGRRAILMINHDITENKKAADSLRQLSGRLLHLQDNERRHLARELHDTTAQNLVALSIKLAQARDSAGGINSTVYRHLSDSHMLVEQCVRELRTLSYLLHPPLLDEAGLQSAIRWYVEGFTQRSGIEVSLYMSPQFARLPREAETALFRIVQESLANIHRHSGSSTARIRIVRSSSAVQLAIEDAGKGMSPNILRKIKRGGAELGVGIAGMSERMRQLGGRLEITSSKQGATVTAVLPLLEGVS